MFPLKFFFSIYSILFLSSTKLISIVNFAYRQNKFPPQFLPLTRKSKVKVTLCQLYAISLTCGFAFGHVVYTPHLALKGSI